MDVPHVPGDPAVLLCGRLFKQRHVSFANRSSARRRTEDRVARNCVVVTAMRQRCVIGCSFILLAGPTSKLAESGLSQPQYLFVSKHSTKRI